jgi:hypothetical protein
MTRSASPASRAEGAVEAITRTGTSDTLDCRSRRSLAIHHCSVASAMPRRYCSVASAMPRRCAPCAAGHSGLQPLEIHRAQLARSLLLGRMLPMPEAVELALTIPAELGPAAAALTELRDRVRSVELERASERVRTGRRVQGRRAVLAQSWCDRPASHEPRRNLRPRNVAGRRSPSDELTSYGSPALGVRRNGNRNHQKRDRRAIKSAKRSTMRTTRSTTSSIAVGSRPMI